MSGRAQGVVGGEGVARGGWGVVVSYRFPGAVFWAIAFSVSQLGAGVARLVHLQKVVGSSPAAASILPVVGWPCMSLGSRGSLPGFGCSLHRFLSVGMSRGLGGGKKSRDGVRGDVAKRVAKEGHRLPALAGRPSGCGSIPARTRPTSTWREPMPER